MTCVYAKTCIYKNQTQVLDEFEEFSEDEYDPDIHIEIPHKNELDLGSGLGSVSLPIVASSCQLGVYVNE